MRTVELLLPLKSYYNQLKLHTCMYSYYLLHDCRMC